MYGMHPENGMEIWVQGTLFDSEPAASALKRPVQRRTLGERRLSGSGGWMPITRDAAVAISHSEGTRIASDFRLGLARSLGRIAPETRQAIRRAVDPARRGNAA
jgi:hypothetical protein